MDRRDGIGQDELDEKIAAYIEARRRREAHQPRVSSRQLVVVVLVAAIVSSLLLSGSLTSSEGTGSGLTVVLAVAGAVALGGWLLHRGASRHQR